MADLLRSISALSDDEDDDSIASSDSEEQDSEEFDEFGVENQSDEDEQAEFSSAFGTPIFQVSSDKVNDFLRRIPMPGLNNGTQSAPQVQTPNYTIPIPGNSTFTQQPNLAPPPKPKLTIVSNPNSVLTAPAPLPTNRYVTPFPTTPIKPTLVPAPGMPPSFAAVSVPTPGVQIPTPGIIMPTPGLVPTPGIMAVPMPANVGSIPMPSPKVAVPLSVQVEPIQKVAQTIQQLQLTPEYSQATLETLLTKLGPNYPDYTEISTLSNKLNGMSLGLTPSACIALAEIIVKKYKYGVGYSPEIEVTIKSVATMLEAK